jgi:AraC-like DNA-binding protein
LLAARRQVEGSDAAITEIAYASGFSDLSHFSRAFRRQFGRSASECRFECRLRESP